jgi:hypothetical protein
MQAVSPRTWARVLLQLSYWNMQQQHIARQQTCVTCSGQPMLLRVLRSEAGSASCCSVGEFFALYRMQVDMLRSEALLCVLA